MPVTVHAAFLDDLRDAQLAQLRREGYAVDLGDEALDHTIVGATWATARLRHLPRRRRAVRSSRELNAQHLSPEVRAGVKRAARAIAKGQNLNPFLSSAYNRPASQDMLFNHWKIHHLHLGPPSAKRVARTDELLFVRFDDDAAYLLKVFRHPKTEGAPTFSKQEMLAIMHRNWPHLLGRPMPGGPPAGEPVSDQTLEDCRRAGVVPVLHVDGVGYMIPGYMTSGHSHAALTMADDVADRAASYERTCRERAEEIADAIAKAVGNRPSQLRLKFLVNGDKAHIVETTTNLYLSVDPGAVLVSSTIPPC